MSSVGLIGFGRFGKVLANIRAFFQVDTHHALCLGMALFRSFFEPLKSDFRIPADAVSAVI